MEKEKFFSGLWIIIGLIFGSVFTNFVYQDYLAYGGTVRSLVLNNTDLYKASISLFFYILFKRGKQYAFIYLGAYLLQPWIFLYSFAFCMAFFFGSMLSLQIVQMGIKGLVLVFMSLFPHFICYVITLLLLIKRNFYAQKKEEMLYEQRHSFLLFHQSVDHVRNPEPLEVIYLGSYTFLYIICHAVKQSSRFVPSKTRISDRLSIYTVTDGLVAIFDITFDHDTLNKRFDLR